jgi:hypothetical protein
VWISWPAAGIHLDVIEEETGAPVVGQFGISYCIGEEPPANRYPSEASFDLAVPFLVSGDLLHVDLTVRVVGRRPAALAVDLVRGGPVVRRTVPLPLEDPATTGRIFVHVVGAGPDVFGDAKGQPYLDGSVHLPGHTSEAAAIWQEVNSRDDRVEVARVGAGDWVVRLHPAYCPWLAVERHVQVRAGEDAELTWHLPPLGRVDLAEDVRTRERGPLGLVLRSVDGDQELRLSRPDWRFVPVGRWRAALLRPDGTEGKPGVVAVEEGRTTVLDLE